MTASLFQIDQLQHPVRYDLLFDHLPRLDEKCSSMGRTGFSSNSLLKALIYKALCSVTNLSNLVFELRNNPSLAQILGFDPYKTTPSVERFSCFLRTTDNKTLQRIRLKIVRDLIENKLINGKNIALDSCPIPIPAKQNNMKTSVKNRFDKTLRLPHDQQARLGVIIHFPRPFQKKVTYFWGYRNHVISDTETELPLWEITMPADVSETKIAPNLLKAIIEPLNLFPQVITGDANYDAEHILKFIIDNLKAVPVIPRNPRGTKKENHPIVNGKVHCQANLEMYRKGKMRSQKSGILYCQYTCPLHYGKQKGLYLVCPIFHESFFKGKGCNVLIRLESNKHSVREQIPYDSVFFKDQYKKRTAVERTFSRLLAIAMQKTSVHGLQAISNHVTIAHIATLLIALAAYKSGQKDKIRFVKSYVPKFMK